jgi:hypothetical protein
MDGITSNSDTWAQQQQQQQQQKCDQCSRP